MLTILLLAAGSSSRMKGADKLLEEVDGAPLLKTLALRAFATPAKVVITLPTDKPLRLQAIEDLDIRTVQVTDARAGMAHSLRAGIAALSKNTTGVMVVPADMPEFTTADFQAMSAAHAATPNTILRGATASQKPGHPVLFPSRFFVELQALSGDTGAREILRKHKSEVKLVPLPGDHALIDLDTPEQWEKWRAAQK